MAGSGRPISCAVTTACTPGEVSAALVSIAVIRPCAIGTAQNRCMKLAGAVEVGDELAAPAEKAQVFDAFDMAADIGVFHRSRIWRDAPRQSAGHLGWTSPAKSS